MIVLLRHAPLSKEFQRKFIGHSNPDIDLSLVEMKKINKLKTMHFDTIFSSDLKRCTQTLDLLNFTYVCDKRLREVQFKEHIEGKSFEEVEALEEYQESYLMNKHTWHQFVCEESEAMFYKRVESFVCELPKEKNVLICSHAGTLKLIHEILSNTPLNTFEYLDTVIL